MGSTQLILREQDVVKLAAEFLENRDMNIAQIALERESGVINGGLSDDVVFLRQLILDGQWEDCLEFIQPLSQLSSFDINTFQFIIIKHKYLELLCIKNEISDEGHENAVEEVVNLLKQLEPLCPTKEEYSGLCLLLTLPKLTDSPEYRHWNPIKARLNCFKLILPLVGNLLSGEKRDPANSLIASNDRLLQLIIKGILYESCVDFCQQKATQSRNNSIEFTTVLNSSDFNDSDLSLLSWLQSIPPDTFSCPFEQKSLNVEIERLQKPQLETSWTEHILMQPIRSNMFPHSAMPISKIKSQDVMTKSLSLLLNRQESRGEMTDMSKSLASFHLTGKKLMDTSVDQLFKERELTPTIKEEPATENNINNKSVLSTKPVLKSSVPTAPKSGLAALPGYRQSQQQQQPVETPRSSREGTPGSPISSRFPETRQVNQEDMGKPKFIKVTTLEDVQAVRCAEFHPDGSVYAVGSNSKTLRICEYPDISRLTEKHDTHQPTVLYKRTKHHKGSIYTLAWSSRGTLLASGSNDKTVKLMTYNRDNSSLEGGDKDLNMHDGTVRDCCFVEEGSGGSTLLLSGGAGDCKVYVTDCQTFTPFQALTGHSGHILSLYTWGGGPIFVSGSQDKTVRFWDLRTRGCVNLVQYGSQDNRAPSEGSPVASCCVDPSGRLLVTGHEDSSVVLYDIRGGRSVSNVKVHSNEVRSVRFSPSAYYLLTASYDGTIVLSDLQGDLTTSLPSVTVASHKDKIITGRWHPHHFSFVSSSADKNCTLWALPAI